MKYLSTRGHPDRKQFCEILLEGLAPDGGLYLPEHYPQLDATALARLRTVHAQSGYAGLAFEILSLYIDDIPPDDLRALCSKTYTQAAFGTKEIVPLKPLGMQRADDHAARDQTWAGDLFHTAQSGSGGGDSPAAVEWRAG